MFQSAPLTEARGDPSVTASLIALSVFQSAPLTEARGDTCPPPQNAWRHRSFNPLPSPKQGETAGPKLIHSLFAVSIRSPHRSKGRRWACTGWAARRSVSIRSPHRSKGRRRCVPPSTATRLSFNPLPSPKQGETWPDSSERSRISSFQSAPLTEARGDELRRPLPCRHSRFNPLPSPKQGETVCQQRRQHRHAGFNPLPSPKQGETPRKGRLSPLGLSFNPLPSPKQGETPCRACAL